MRTPLADLLSGLAPSALLLLAACGGGGGGPLAPQGPASPDAPPAPAGVTFGPVEVEAAWSALDLRLTTDRAARVDLSWTAADGTPRTWSGEGFGTEHTIYLTDLAPGQAHDLHAVASAADGTAADLSFSASTLVPGRPRSDEFARPNLDRGLWSLHDPHGLGQLRLVDPGGPASSLELSVPAGTAYLPWTQGHEALAVSQPVADGDLLVQACFRNGLSAEGTGNGFLFETAEGSFLRFDFAFNGGELQLFAGHVTDSGVQSLHLQDLQAGAWPDGLPLYLEVARSGDQWTQRWSMDGSSWMPGASFVAPVTLARMGLTAINSGAPAQAHTVRVDWVREATDPPTPEDTAYVADQRAPWAYRLSLQALDEHTVRAVLGSDEPSLGLVQWGLDETFAGGSQSLGDPAFLHEALASGLEPETTYLFRAQLSDSGGRSGWSETFAITTPAPGVTGVPELDLWYADELGPNQWTIDFGQSGHAQPQFNLLGNLADADEDRVALTVGLRARLNGGPWRTLSVGDDRTIDDWPQRLQNEGDFNLELFATDLATGPWDGAAHRNTVELLAQDDDGHLRLATVEVRYHPGVVWQPPVDQGWEGVLAGTQALDDLVQVVDGKWHVEDHPDLGAVLRLDAGHQGYDRLLALGEAVGPAAWTDYEARVTGTVLGLDPLGYTTGTSSHALGLGARWTGHTEGWGASEPNHNIYPLGGLFVYRWFDATERWELWVDPEQKIVKYPAYAHAVELGTTYEYRLRVTTTPGGGATYRLRRWVQGEPEPVDWQLQHTTPDWDVQDAGSLYLVAHHVDVAWGRITVTPLD